TPISHGAGRDRFYGPNRTLLSPSRRNNVPPRACVRRSGAQIAGRLRGAFVNRESRASHQRDGARGFVSGLRAPNRRLCSSLARSAHFREKREFSLSSATPLSRE